VTEVKSHGNNVHDIIVNVISTNAQSHKPKNKQMQKPETILGPARHARSMLLAGKKVSQELHSLPTNSLDQF